VLSEPDTKTLAQVLQMMLLLMMKRHTMKNTTRRNMIGPPHHQLLRLAKKRAKTRGKISLRSKMENLEKAVKRTTNQAKMRNLNHTGVFRISSKLS
jgi:hypothetical protein